MSKLEELIKELCPNGVEYKKIGEVCDTITDYTAAGAFADIAKNVKYINNQGYAQLIRTTDLKSNFRNTEKFVYVDEHAFNYLWRVNLNTEGLVLPNVGNCGEVYYIYPNILPQTYNVLGPNAIWVKSSISNIRYLYHLFLSSDFQYSLSKIISPTGQTKFNKTNFKSLSIPVPPLPVQEEIVRILDSYSESVAKLKDELSAELIARKKQYEYYRDLILDKNKDAKWIPLLDTADTYTGLTYKPINVSSTGTLVLRSSNIQNNRVTYDDNVYVQMDNIPERAIVKENDILICVRNGSKALIGKAAIIPPHTSKMAFGAFMTILRAKENIDYRYLFFVWQSPRIQNLIHGDSGMPINQITKKMLEQIKIPVPSLENQKEIYKVLEQFETLSFNISEGLPAEIELRQKQYEYYRDKLLTFERLS